MGEIFMLNAEPFPDQTGRLGRILCSKTDLVDSGWTLKWYPEEKVQQIFREVGQTIPKPPGPIPPPYDLPSPSRPPLGQRIEDYFGNITSNWGIGRMAGTYLMWATFALIVIGAIVLCLLGWRKWR
jgi:hypothetical protein